MENKTFTTTSEIIDEIEGFVRDHRKYSGIQHGREILDDLIADLIDYRETLPTTDEYEEAGKL